MKFYPMLFIVLLTVTLSCGLIEDGANDDNFGGEFNFKRESDKARNHGHHWHAGRREAEQPDEDEGKWLLGRRDLLDIIPTIVGGVTEIIGDIGSYLNQLVGSGVLAYLNYADGRYYYGKDIDINQWANRLTLKYGRSRSYWIQVLRNLPESYTQYAKDKNILGQLPRRDLLDIIPTIVGGLTEIIGDIGSYLNQLLESGVLAYLNYADGKYYYSKDIDINQWANRLTVKYGRNRKYWTQVLLDLPQSYTQYAKDKNILGQLPIVG